MDSVTVMAIVRHLLTFLGGIFIALGWLDQQIVDQMIGAGVTVIGVVWSVWEKWSRPQLEG